MSEVENNDSSIEKESLEYVTEGKNKFIVKCKFCGSKILDKQSAVYLPMQKELPLMQQLTNKKEGEIQNENLIGYYHVKNMYAFENVGFTHKVGNFKYLSCADCDAGPIGYHAIDTKDSFVAISRIVHA